MNRFSKLILIVLMVLNVTGGADLFRINTAYALIQNANWAFTGNATGWSNTNGTATNSCGDNNSSTVTNMATWAYNANTWGAVGGATASTGYRGQIYQKVAIPGSSGTVKVNGRLDYSVTKASGGSGTWGSAWVRLDVYDAANSAFVGNLSCTAVTADRALSSTGYDNTLSLNAGATYTVRVSIATLNGTNARAKTFVVDNVVVTTAPIGLATSMVSGLNTLNWTTSTATSTAPAIHGTTPYKVYRKTSTPVTTSDFLANATTNSYTDSSVSPNTQYYYAVTNVDANGVESPLSAEANLTSLALPTVTTQAASNITQTSATGNGNITVTPSSVSADKRGFVYDTASRTLPGNVTPTSSGYVSYVEDAGTYSTGAYTKGISGLTGNTTYYVRAYTHTPAGYSYGGEVSFVTSPVLPTVSTELPTSIDQTTATGNGTISATGGENADIRGFVYDTSTHSLPGNVAPGSSGYASSASDGGSFTVGAFTKALSSLTGNTTYYIRSFAHNSAGYSYGDEETFLTSPVLPTVTTQAATDVTSSSATGNGNITATGGASPDQRGFVYGTASQSLPGNVAPASSGYASSVSEFGTYTTGAYTGSLSSLTSNATYYIRAYVHTTAGYSYGEEQSFATPAAFSLPTMMSSLATNITQTSVTANGSIFATGGQNANVRGFVYDTSSHDLPGNVAPGLTSYPSAVSDSGSFGAVSYSKNIFGLTGNTTYYYRSYAHNTAGYAYGGEISFTTSPVLPTVTTQAVSDIAQTSATGNGNITATGGGTPDKRGFVYGTVSQSLPGDVAPGSSGYASYAEDAGTYTTGAYTKAISGLTGNTTYYVRAYTHTSAGYSYGDEVSFLTSPVLPTVTTQAVSSIGETTATGNGNITATGGATPDKRGFVYGTASQSLPGNVVPASSGYDSNVEDAGTYTTGAYTKSITGLTGSVTYYVRAYTHTSAGYSYGEEVSFTTNTPATAPDAPTSLTAIAGYAQNNLSWIAPASDGGSAITGYKIYRDTSSSPTTLLATLGVVSVYRDATAVPGTTYYYRVKAMNAVGDSSYSTQDSALTFGSTTKKVVFLTDTSATSWAVPSDWDSTDNMIELIGGGTGSYGNGDGGGGGAYSLVTNQTLTPGDTVAIKVGSGGTPGNAGGDTYLCNSASNCGSIGGTTVVVGAKGGSFSGGGAAGSGVGTVKYSGGNNGTGAWTGGGYGGPGGGGAAGPNGNGGNGGNVSASGYGSGGGGGSGGGSNGGIGASGFASGAGGNNAAGTGGGSGGDYIVSPQDGTDGGGGGGGGYYASGNGDGGGGTEWDSTHGAGGGGGGTAGSDGGGSAGSGGLYGGAAGGTGYGGVAASGGQGIIVITYTPKVSAPTVTTQSASSVTQTTATGNGNITATGGESADQRGFVYDTSTHTLPGNVAPGASGYASNASDAGTFSTGAYTKSLSSLTGNTTYYIRSFAHNSAGYSYGNEVTFLTSPVLPTVTTQAVSSIAETTATGNGNITATGGATPDKRGFVYGTASQSLPGNVAPASSGYDSNVEDAGTYTTGAYTKSITGLTGSVTYYVRAYTHTSAGYSYGGEVSFTTQAGATVPGVPSNVTATAQVGSVLLTWSTPDNGGSEITGYKIYRGTSPSPTNLLTTVGVQNSYTDNSASTTTLNYYRIKATNAIGDSNYSSNASATASGSLTSSNRTIKLNGSRIRVIGSKVYYR